MSVSLALLLQRLLQCVSTVQSSMHTQKGEHWFFPLDNKAWPTWVLAWVRLLPLSAGCLYRSQTYASKFLNIFTLLWTSLQRGATKQPLTNAFQCESSYRLINDKESNVQSGTPNERGKIGRWISAAISRSFDWLNVALLQLHWILDVFDSSTFRESVVVAAGNTSLKLLKRGISMLYDIQSYCWSVQYFIY